MNEAVDSANDFASTNENIGQEAEVGEIFEAGVDGQGQHAEVGESYEAGADEHEHQDNGEYEGEVPYEDEVDASYYVGNEDSHVQETNGEAEQGEESGHINIDTEAAASGIQNNRNAENDDGGEISYEDDDVDGSLSVLVENGETDGKPVVTDANQNHKEETDEIDYDDDDEVSLFAGSGPTTPAKPLAAGKRPHEEDGEANGIDGQGKIYCLPRIERLANFRTEAKRPRS